jgi:hypothetical protein
MKRNISCRFLFGTIVIVVSLFSQISVASSPVGKQGGSLSKTLLPELQVIYYRISNGHAKIYIDTGNYTTLTPGGFNTFCQYQQKPSLAEEVTAHLSSEPSFNKKVFLEPIKTYFVRLDKKEHLQAVSSQQAKSELRGIIKEIHSYSGLTSLKNCQNDVSNEGYQVVSKSNESLGKH